MIAGLCLCALLIPGTITGNTFAADENIITGKVVEVHGDSISIKSTSGPAASIGDIAELSFRLGGEQFKVGTWRVTRLAGGLIEAVKIKATLDAATGMNARIVPAVGGSGAQEIPGQTETLETVTVPRRAVPMTPKLLRIMTTRSFQLVWKDKGSGAHRDFAVWRPEGWNGYHPLGDVANASPWPGKRYPPPDFETLLVRGGKPPVGYRMIWNTERSHPDRPFSSWTPVAPAGYVCLGDVGSTSLNVMPPLDAIRCLPQKCVIDTGLGKKIWDDTGSGARLDFSAWLIPGANVYVGNASHKKPKGTFYTISPECR